jgi:hypothetical protein
MALKACNECGAKISTHAKVCPGCGNEPWIVEAALDRLRPILSPADQRIILKATRTPHSVKWPEWWSEHP